MLDVREQRGNMFGHSEHLNDFPTGTRVSLVPIRMSGDELFTMIDNWSDLTQVSARIHDASDEGMAKRVEWRLNSCDFAAGAITSKPFGSHVGSADAEINLRK
nr:hypothetical protein [Caballeronia arvi]